MKKFLLFLALFLTGCSVKTALKQDPVYEKTLTYTQRGQIINSLETKALVDAVYLNPLYKDKFKNPVFLIGVYNDFNNTLVNREFNITLNSKQPSVTLNKIPPFILYKHFPFYNEWMKYYIVEFNETQKPYILQYKSRDWGDVNFTF
ncbi:hypothetical protein [Nautilia sp.]